LVQCQAHYHHHQGPAFTTPSGAPALKLSKWTSWITCRSFIHASLISYLQTSRYMMNTISAILFRGVHLRSTMRNVDDRDVKLTNRWRSFNERQGWHLHLTMQDHYSGIRLIIPVYYATPKPFNQLPGGGHSSQSTFVEHCPLFSLQ